MTNKRGLLIGAGLLLALVSGAVWASHPKIVWIPAELKPDSIAPGESATYALTLKHVRGAPLTKTRELRIAAEDVPFATITQPTFPGKFKKGDSVTVTVTVSVPTGTPMGVHSGELELVRVKKGKEKDVRGARELPVELTFSAFHLPPTPDPNEDQATILGIDQDDDGVPDRVNRWIGFQAPESEKLRAALTLSAKAQQDFFKDYLAHAGEDPEDEAVRARVRAVADVGAKASNCLQYVLGATEGFEIPGAIEKFDAYSRQNRELETLFMDTPERIRAFWQSERPLVATGYPDVPDEQLKQECLDLDFDPDILPN